MFAFFDWFKSFIFWTLCDKQRKTALRRIAPRADLRLGLRRGSRQAEIDPAKPAPAHARASAVEPNERVKRPRRDGALVTHNDAAANVDAHVAIDQARYAGTAMR